MRLALVTPGFSATADHWAIPALQTLAATLAHSLDVTVFSQRYPAKGVYQFDNLTHFALGGGEWRGVYSPWVWGQTVQAIVAQHCRAPFDLLHAFWADEAGLAAILAGAIIKKPVIVSIGGWELTALPEIGYGAQLFWTKRQLLRYVFRQAIYVTAGSPYQFDLCQPHIAAAKLKLAPLGVDAERFAPSVETSLSQQPLTLVQAASLVPVKNQALLLQVFSLLKKRLPQLRLQLIGSGPLQADLQALAEKLHVADQVVWQQQVAYPDMPAHYQGGQVYLQTSHHESQGMAVLEAMACGLPALGTPVGVVRDEACLPATTSSDLLAQQVLALFDDGLQYHHFRQAARQTVLDKYSLPVTSNTFLKLYQQTVETNSK